MTMGNAFNRLTDSFSHKKVLVISSQGAKVTGPDGKALKKDELVEQILSA